MDAQCDVSPVLEFGKGVFDPVPGLVQVLVEVDFSFPMAATANAGLDSHLFEFVPDPVGVVAAVGDKMRDRRHDLEQFPEAIVVADIAAGQVEAEGSSLRVRKRLQLGGRPAPASSDGALFPHSRRHAH